MTRKIFFFLFTLTVLFSSNYAQADFTRIKIAVLDFQLQGEHFENKDMGVIVAEWFITAMVREGRFDVVERRLLQKILSEQKLAMSGVIDTDSASTLGKLLGVKVIISGSVMKIQNSIEINARIIDVESGSIIAAENVRSNGTGGLQDLVVHMSRKIIRNFPLEGYVVNRNGDTVTLDLGIVTGVKKGMHFIVYKEGQVIKHPKTGEVLDVERIETGIVYIDQVFKNICKAHIVSEKTPNSVNYGQLVKSRTDTVKNKADTKPKISSLTVTTQPSNARVRILNIVEPYRDGIVLDPGKYQLEISAPGFHTHKEWVTLNQGEQKAFSYSLVSKTNSEQPNSSQSSWSTSTAQQPSPKKETSRRLLSSKQQRFINMLTSSSIRSRKDAAKIIIRERMTDTIILDVVEEELLKGYKKNGGRQHIDTLSWFCKALGSSGIGKYRSTLRMVSEKGAHRKLRKYAKKSLLQL